MGMSYDSYVAYGVLVQRPGGVDFDLIEAMDTGGSRENEIMKRYQVGHLLAGNYDQDMLFIVTESFSVELGSYAIIDNDTIEHFDYDENHNRLQNAVSELGLEVLNGPGWVLIPDLG